MPFSGAQSQNFEPPNTP